MRALVVRGPGQIELEERSEPALAPGSILIRPTAVGLCGTDLEIIDGGVDPAYIRLPLVIGHEWSGIVVDAGTAHGGGGPAPGAKVVVEGIVPCRHCSACVAGDTNLCTTYDEFGFVRDGAAADLLVAPAELVHVLRPGVSAESGALVEPAAVVWRALMRVSPRPGLRVLVVGDGTVGLLAVTLLQLWSPASVTLLGARPDQAVLAHRAGVTRFLTEASEAGTTYDLVIEAAGAVAAVTTALAAVRRGGNVVLLGLAAHGLKVELPVDDLVNGDITVAGSFSYTATAWAQIVNLLNSGRIDLGFLVTHRFPLAHWSEAIATLRNTGGPRGKVLLDIG